LLAANRSPPLRHRGNALVEFIAGQIEGRTQGICREWPREQRPDRFGWEPIDTLTRVAEQNEPTAPVVSHLSDQGVGAAMVKINHHRVDSVEVTPLEGLAE
jgi:hypothetical protein